MRLSFASTTVGRGGDDAFRPAAPFPGTMLGAMIRVRAIVFGRVQGVWYRQSCRDVAVAAGLRGWVRNNADGTVEAVLEGDAQSVKRVVEWMREGPSRAVVDDLRLTHEPPAEESSFVIR